ncbi:metal ABC transporter substrate-binding protein [Lachnospiraceae bacterium ASD3451]|uniref:metal ABC transporter substrate-binding protein n=1 Tax=Diplocloster agilis TaxID=2850323 RepID=UPI001E04BC3B|nr:metal ABC transporter substrate-binding protein [Diplocloster agilis]MBU9746504.1 metal ABC transporter substrate-binding protein [Diplocloster agilis]
MKNKYVFTGILLAVITAISAAVIHFVTITEEPHEEREGTLEVVTSFYPMYIAAENVIGDIPGVQLTNMTGPQTGCLHDYQLSPEDMQTLSGADVFIINGGGIESFLDTVLKNYPGLPVITASDGISMLEMKTFGAGHEEDGHEGHDHGDENPHVWMDVSKYMQEVDNIAGGLASLDPVHAEQYRQNAEAYRKKLEPLRVEASKITGKTGQANIIIFHDSFAYFADAYGLQVAEVIEIEEDNTLSAGQLAHLMQVIKEKEVQLLFVEKQYSTKVAEAVAKESGAKVYVLDSLVTGDGDPDSYIRGMEENLAVLREAL